MQRHQIRERRGVRRLARESALQLLFACDFHSNWSDLLIANLAKCYLPEHTSRDYAVALVKGTVSNLEEIDSKITCASLHWSVSRMSRVDRCILRIALFEMFYDTDMPFSVVINEAVEVAKRFGADESPNFVNGILDRAAQSLKSPSVAKNDKEGEGDSLTPAKLAVVGL